MKALITTKNTSKSKYHKMVKPLEIISKGGLLR